MFTRKVKPSAVWYWKFLSSNSLQASSVESVETAKSLSLQDEELTGSYVSLDEFSKTCLQEYQQNEACVNTDISEICTGRPLYNNENMDGFYKSLKKITDSKTYLKQSLNPSKNLSSNSRPTKMAQLLAAQISTDDMTGNEKKGHKNCFMRFWGRCFSRLTGKKRQKRQTCR